MAFLREIKKIPKSIAKAIRTTPHIAIFNYHQVSNSFTPQRHTKQTWTSIKQFKNNIQYIRNNMPVISLSEAIERINDNKIHRAYAVITFDDGDKSILEEALPWLHENRIPATLFINSGCFSNVFGSWGNIAQRFRGSINSDWNDELEELFLPLRHCTDRNEYLKGVGRIESLVSTMPTKDSIFISKDELSCLDSDLFQVGLHGREHQRFIHYPKDWQSKAMQDDIDSLSDLPQYIPVFAVPFGRPQDWDYDTLSVAWEKGLEIVLADGGVNHRKQGVINRIPADRSNIRRLWKKNRVL